MAVDIIARALAAKAGKSSGGATSGYFYNGKFYEDAEHTTEITPEEGKLYLDIDSNTLYIYRNDEYVPLSGEKKYSTTIVGDGSTTEFTIAHNLGSISAYVLVLNQSANDVIVDVTRTSANSFIISFGEAPASGTEYYVYVISGVGTGARGPQGADGNGIASAVLNSNYTLTINFTDGTTYTTPSIRGEAGAPGAKGQDGERGVSIYDITSSQSGGKTIVTIVLDDGTTKTFEVQGTTYTAGTGISIVNGVISCTLADANEVLY